MTCSCCGYYASDEDFDKMNRAGLIIDQMVLEKVADHILYKEAYNAVNRERPIRYSRFEEELGKIRVGNTSIMNGITRVSTSAGTSAGYTNTVVPAKPKADDVRKDKSNILGDKYRTPQKTKYGGYVPIEQLSRRDLNIRCNKFAANSNGTGGDYLLKEVARRRKLEEEAGIASPAPTELEDIEALLRVKSSGRKR